MSGQGLEPIDFWFLVLVDAGFMDEQPRVEAVARFLAINEFTKLEHLEDADSPDSWMGAQELRPNELSLVAALCARQEAARRSVLLSEGSPSSMMLCAIM